MIEPLEGSKETAGEVVTATKASSTKRSNDRVKDVPPLKKNPKVQKMVKNSDGKRNKICQFWFRISCYIHFTPQLRTNP